MKKQILFIAVLLCANFVANAQTLLHSWNFNNSTSLTTLLAPNTALVPGASITHNKITDSEIPLTGNTTGQGFETTNPNARNSDVAGAHLRFNNAVGGNLVFALPTTGYKNVVVKYATRRSTAGAFNQIIDYSIDGTNYINFTTIMPVAADPTLQTLDFSPILGANNNPNFKIKISFTQGGGGLAGNNRFDNFTLEGDIAYADALLHYWNFNNATSVATITTPNIALIAGSSLTHIAGGTSAINFASSTGQNFDTNNLNARNLDAAGNHLRFDNAIGGALVFALPTTNSKDIVVKYVGRRSTQGAGTHVIEYSTDGTNYVAFSNQAITEVPVLQTLDFSAIAAVNNNPNFKIKITFTAIGGGTGGNTRIDNFTVDGKTLIADATAPTVVFAPLNNVLNLPINTHPKISFNEAIRLINNNAITDANVGSLIELRVNDATGATVAFNATISGSVINIVPTAVLLNGQKYYVAIKPNVIEDFSNNAIVTTLSSVFTTAPNQIAFKNTFLSVSEADGSVNVVLTLTDPTISSAKLVLKGSPFSNISASDITYATQVLNFTAASSTTQTITIPINNDLLAEMDEYFVLSLEDLNGVALSGKQFSTIYIRDNDRQAPVPTQELTLNYTSSFKPNTLAGSTTEIVVHDAASQRLYMTSSVQDRLDIANFTNPAAITLIKSIDMAPYGGITSVAVKNGVVAVACPNANEQLDGKVVFFNTDGDFIKQVTVGALPDMITFSPDGNKIFTANEGQPNTTYTVDPEGSVSIIDISGGIASVNQTKVTTLLLTGFNAQEATLIASGVRKTRLTSTLSQDFEPEYVTVSADSKKAWVVLQENNAIAEIDLVTNTYTSIWPLGKKDFNTVGSGLDASDNSGKVHIANFPVKSYFEPDGIANYTANGKTYLVTANEGDEKEYGTFVERTTVDAVTLDPTIFPNAEVLKESFNIGRLRISSFNGDTDGDGDYDELLMPGARSFSIFDIDTKSIVYDSKDDMELITSKSPITAAFFNADNGSTTLKNRSRAKGPEPEGVTLATIAGKVYAFVGLERIGGIMVYNITDPTNVKFVDYKNNRTATQATSDLGPEGIIYIDAISSPTGKPYVMIANEISGNISVFELQGAVLPITLSRYTAKLASNGNVFLNWNTASETNNNYFTIERSVDGKIFEFLTQIATKGNGNIAQAYSFIDKTPAQGVNYYRLSQTDINGDKGSVEIRDVNVDLAANDEWNTYPNPVTGNSIFVTSNKINLKTVDIKLFSLHGQLIYKGKQRVNNGKFEIKLSEKPSAGVYILNVDGLGTQQLLIK